MGQEFNQVKESSKWIERKYTIEMMKKTDIQLKNISLEVPKMDMNMINTTFPSHLILHLTQFYSKYSGPCSQGVYPYLYQGLFIIYHPPIGCIWLREDTCLIPYFTPHSFEVKLGGKQDTWHCSGGHSVINSTLLVGGLYLIWRGQLLNSNTFSFRTLDLFTI